MEKGTKNDFLDYIPKRFIKTIRILALFSLFSTTVFLIIMAHNGFIRFNEFLPYYGLLTGLLPLVIFVFIARVKCNFCGGRMKIFSGYPTIKYICNICGKKTETGILSD